jgi:hypothetical protein
VTVAYALVCRVLSEESAETKRFRASRFSPYRLLARRNWRKYAPRLFVRDGSATGFPSLTIRAPLRRQPPSSSLGSLVSFAQSAFSRRCSS